jgi:hypothetical protein
VTDPSILSVRLQELSSEAVSHQGENEGECSGLKTNLSRLQLPVQPTKSPVLTESRVGGEVSLTVYRACYLTPFSQPVMIIDDIVTSFVDILFRLYPSILSQRHGCSIHFFQLSVKAISSAPSSYENHA